VTRVEGVRARARAAATDELLTIARRHLAESGAAALSLRAIARDAEMVSSAIYRYFPSRDALLTTLIVGAFDSLGESVERAEAAVARDDLLGRWRAAAHALRAWAKSHPHEYGLVYGSPVPGYAAPADTIAPATRVPLVLVGILADAPARLPDDMPMISAAVSRNMTQLAGQLGLTDKPGAAEWMVRGVMAWTHLFGSVSFELFGHTNNVIDDHDAFYTVEVERLGLQVLGDAASVRPVAHRRRNARTGRDRSLSEA
jgi:AcrR family transcriptional regulator